MRIKTEAREVKYEERIQVGTKLQQNAGRKKKDTPKHSGELKEGNTRNGYGIAEMKRRQTEGLEIKT